MSSARDIARTADAAARSADATGRSQWLVLRFPAPLRDALELLDTDQEDLFYWENPAANVQAVAAGAAGSIEAAGPTRFEACAREVRALLANVARIGTTRGEPWEPFRAEGG